jgi:hypothetical protein
VIRNGKPLKILATVAERDQRGRRNKHRLVNERVRSRVVR